MRINATFQHRYDWKTYLLLQSLTGLPESIIKHQCFSLLSCCLSAQSEIQTDVAWMCLQRAEMVFCPGASSGFYPVLSAVFRKETWLAEELSDIWFGVKKSQFGGWVNEPVLLILILIVRKQISNFGMSETVMSEGTSSCSHGEFNRLWLMMKYVNVCIYIYIWTCRMLVSTQW